MNMSLGVTHTQRLVAEHFNVTVEQLVGTSRDHGLGTARQIAFYLERMVEGRTFVEIGRLYQRDHSTIVAGNNHMKERLAAVDVRYTQHVQVLEPKLNQYMRPAIVADVAPVKIHCPTCGAPVIQELQRQIAVLTERLNQVEGKR